MTRKPDLTDRTPLDRRIRKLATEASVIEDGWRRIGVDGGDLVMAVVTEIGETILPCRLTLRSAAGVAIQLDAGGGRLNRVVGPLPAPLGAFEPVCNRDCGADPDTLAQVLDLLRAHSADGSFLWVRSADSPEEPSAIVGLSEQALAQALVIRGGERSGNELSEVFETFAEALLARAQCWVRLSGDTVVDRADATDMRSLRDAGSYARQVVFAAVKAGSFQNGPTFLVASSGNDDCIAALSLGEAELVAILSRDASNSLTEEWLRTWRD